jgi:hypothetical protein
MKIGDKVKVLPSTHPTVFRHSGHIGTIIYVGSEMGTPLYTVELPISGLSVPNEYIDVYDDEIEVLWKHTTLN